MSNLPPDDASTRARIKLVRTLTQRLDVPLAILSLVFMALVGVQIATGPNEPHAAWVEAGIWGIWALFLLEFLVKLAIYPDRAAYLRKRWFDLVVLIVPTLRVLRAVQALRGFRLFRVLMLGNTYGRVMWLFRIGIAARRGIRGASKFWRRSRFDLVLALTGVVVILSASLMVLLERGEPTSRIRTFGDALWWSAAIVTTVASDLDPVTPGGRILAVFMMVYGVTVFGYFVSQLVNLLQKPANSDSASQKR